MGEAEHVLINCPTKINNVPQYHQIYFGQKDNHCFYFNADIPKGEREGPCNKIISLAASQIKLNDPNDGRECLVAKSYWAK